MAGMLYVKRDILEGPVPISDYYNGQENGRYDFLILITSYELFLQNYGGVSYGVGRLFLYYQILL